MVVAVIGVIFVGGRLERAWPRDVEISYRLDQGSTAVDIDYLQESEAVASARFKQLEAKATVVRHTVRLQPGEYQARITVYGSDNRGVRHTRVLFVPAEGITRFDLTEAGTEPE